MQLRRGMFLRVLPLLLSRHVMSHSATDNRAGNRVMSCYVSCHCPNGRAFETACCLGLTNAEAQHSYCCENRVLHFLVPLFIFAYVELRRGVPCGRAICRGNLPDLLRRRPWSPAFRSIETGLPHGYRPPASASLMNLSIPKINRSDCIPPIACCDVQVWRDIVKMRMPKEDLNGLNRVPLGDKATGKCPPSRMAAVSGTEARRAIQTRHVALQAVDRQISCSGAIKILATLHAQLERPTLLREDQPCVRHKTTILALVQRGAVTAYIAPIDIPIAGSERLRV